MGRINGTLDTLSGKPSKMGKTLKDDLYRLRRPSRLGPSRTRSSWARTAP